MAAITLSITEVRDKFLPLIREAKEFLEEIIITKNGKPEAVLMSYEEYEGWLETLEITRDPELMAGIHEAKADIKAGRLYTKEEVFGAVKKAKNSTKRK
jgi:prevent-host-death family protein